MAARRDPDMAAAADTLARTYDITRETQDAWATRSHSAALKTRLGPSEITVINDQDHDPFTRRMTPALAARAKVVCGSITMANMAVAADGAAFCIVVSDSVRRRLGARGVQILGGATKGAAPELPGIAPLAAIKSAFEQTSLRAEQITCAEIMEAFAVQAVACVEGAQLDPARVNLGGGALARGHPIGASGTINAVRLYHQLLETGGTGLAAIAAAGGIATALILTA